MYLSNRRIIKTTPSVNVYHNPFDRRTIATQQSNQKYINNQIKKYITSHNTRNAQFWKRISESVSNFDQKHNKASRASKL